MSTRIIFSGLFIALLLTAGMLGQTVKLDKPLDDGTGKFAQKIAPWFEGPDASPEKTNSIGPLVTGLYGFKTLRITNIAIGKIEAAHINICRIMLGVYDDELDAHLRMLTDKGTKANGFYYPTAAEIAVVQKYVVQKHAAKYMGFTPDMKPVEVDQVAWWKFSAGSALGELAADVTGWHKFRDNPAYDKSIQERLQALDKTITSAPAGTSSTFLADLRTLKALGAKTASAYAERQAIAAALSQTLASAATLADVKSTPTYLDKAVGTYQVTNTLPFGKSSQLELRLKRIGAIIDAEMTDSGGARTLKFDTFQIKPDGTYSFKLTHKNGAVMSGTGQFAADFSTFSGRVSHQAKNINLNSTWSGKRKAF